MWNLFFMAVLWFIWKERNRRCFEGFSSNDNQIREKVKQLVAIRAFSLPLFKGISAKSIINSWKEVAFSHLHKSSIVYRRTPPSSGALKLNFDRSAQGNRRIVGVGCVICNDQGITLLSYSDPAGPCSINKAEVLSLNIGLREALRFNPQLLVIEGDSSCVIKWVSQPSTAHWYLEDIIGEVIENSKNVNISFHLIKRGANLEADRLAKEGVSRPSLLIITDC